MKKLTPSGLRWRKWQDKINPWTKKKCVVCGKLFSARKKNKIKILCGKMSCRKRRLKPFKDTWEDKRQDKKIFKVHFVENEFSKNKYKYDESTIDYKGSPTGKAYIGLAKQPLMKNENGIGYQGVKMQSENRELIQCYECGRWFKVISTPHLKRHGLTIREYKDKYGFFQKTSLISDVQSNFLANQMVNNVNKLGKRLPSEKLLKMMWEKRTKKRGERTREYQNLHGTCPEQLKQNLVNHIRRFHRIPHSPSGRDGFMQIGTLKKRFGSMNNALKNWGLPVRYKLGAVVQYCFEDGTNFVTKQGKGYEELFMMMLKKCPVLTK